MRGFNFRVRYIELLVLLGLIGGCATFEEELETQGFKQLNAAEIQSTFAGNTLIFKFVGSESTFTVFVAADGTLRGMRVSPTGKHTYRLNHVG